MKAIVIDKMNQAEIEQLIKDGQKGARTRLIDADDVFYRVRDVEKRLFLIPKKYWNGITATVNVNAQKFANAYHGVPMATYFTVIYKNRSWRLVEVYRHSCNNREIVCEVPDEVKKLAATRIIDFIERGLPI